MKKLIILFIRRPVTVIMILASVIIAAVFSLFSLPVNRLPDFSVPVVTVETVYYGMAADEVRSLVTMPLEDSLSSLRGLERMRSISRDGRSIISLDFRWGTNVMEASTLVREAIDRVYPVLPEGIKKPAVLSADNSNEAHAIIAVYSHNGNLQFAHDLAEYELRARLRRIDGAGSVILVGSEIIEERLSLDMPRLSAFGLSPAEITRLIAHEISDIPAGNARDGNSEIVVVSSGRPDTRESLYELIVPSENGAINITDTGTLGSVPARRESIFVYNGREAVALEVYRRQGADPLRLSREIKKTIEEANNLFSRDAQIDIVIDSTPSLLDGIKSLIISAILGAAAVFFVLMIFIRHLKYSFLAALSIPVSIAAGITMLAVTGRSLNTMSLSGLAIGIGLVSDTCVIIINLLHRFFDKTEPIFTAEEIGNKVFSIAGSSFASTLTTSLVFLPVIFLPGVMGSLFGDIAFSLTISVAAGWLYAQFCLPSLFVLFSNSKRKNILNKFSLEKKYGRFLKNILRRPLKVYVVTLLITIIGISSLFFIPVVFVNPDESEEIWISIISPPGTLPESSAIIGAEISELVSGLRSVKTVFGRAGAEEEDIIRRADIDYIREEFIFRCVPEKNVNPETVSAEIDLIMENFEIPYSIYYPKDRTEILLGLSSRRTFVISGKNREELLERRNEIADYFDSKSVSVNFRPEGKRPELRILPNREAAAYLSISASQIAETLFILNEGIVAANLEINGKPLDMRITGEKSNRDNPVKMLEQIPIITGQGKLVFLGSFGKIEQREAESSLARLDRSDILYADLLSDSYSEANIASSLFNWFSSANESVLSRYRLSIIIYLILVLILLYLTMGAQFESFLLPLILMVCIPFSLAGAGPFLLIFDSMIDSGAILGIAALFGLVVNSSLVLFEISSEKIKNGFSPAAAVYKGACERLGAIIITAATTIFALFPLLFSPLGNSQKSMAAAMLGGLSASVILSLFAIPPVLVRYFKWIYSKRGNK